METIERIVSLLCKLIPVDTGPVDPDTGIHI